MSKTKEHYEFGGYRISKEENTFLNDLRLDLALTKCLPTALLSGFCTMSAVYAFGRFRRNVKSIEIVKNGSFGAVTGLAWSLYDAKFIQNAKILEEKPKSRLSFVVRQDLSQRFRYIMNEKECLELNEDSRESFHREDSIIFLFYGLVIWIARFKSLLTALIAAGEIIFEVFWQFYLSPLI